MYTDGVGICSGGAGSGSRKDKTKVRTTADEKGVAYSSGYIVTEVVTALLADKGLDKLKNVAKTGKTVDNVADIAEGAAKGAESAAADAGKVVEW